MRGRSSRVFVCSRRVLSPRARASTRLASDSRVFPRRVLLSQRARVSPTRRRGPVSSPTRGEGCAPRPVPARCALRGCRVVRGSATAQPRRTPRRRDRRPPSRRLHRLRQPPRASLHRPRRRLPPGRRRAPRPHPPRRDRPRSLPRAGRRPRSSPPGITRQAIRRADRARPRPHPSRRETRPPRP